MTDILPGTLVPDVTFKTRVRDERVQGPNPFVWEDLTTNDIFDGKRVVVFALPGAFTPTCTSKQLPGFETHYDFIRYLGVDEVYCLSVNDAFVMHHWINQRPGPKKVKMIPDGSGKFTEAMGMLVSKDNLGFGKRSWRYAMVVNDKEIEKMFIEPGMMDECPDDPYGDSSAETVIEYLKSVHSNK